MVGRTLRFVCLTGVLVAGVGIVGVRTQPATTPLQARPDPYVGRPRVFVLTDIANEPDDQMSLVRLLVYAEGFDIEGLVATTSTWMRTGTRVDVIRAVLDAYAEVQPRLATHASGYPTADALRAVVAAGQGGYGMAAVGDGRATEGSARLLAAARRDDPRPLWVLAWGGTNTLAQALGDARATLSTAELASVVDRLRVYAISDQDDAGPWLRREFPTLRYIASPSTQDGQEYAGATWTGISGDRFYRNAPGADFTTFADAWVDANIRARGPLGRLYPYPCCIHEGDTPSFLGLIDNGLASAMSPTFGGWGGRYVWRQPRGESRPFWTQGGDAYPGNDDSRDTVTGAGGLVVTSDQATVWRWREAFQHDFAARMAWTVLPRAEANHAPEVVVQGHDGRGPVMVSATVGTPVRLEARGSDPDGDALRYRWWYYAEAATGLPGMPVVRERRRPPVMAPTGGSPPAARGDRPGPRVTLQGDTTPVVTITPVVAGVAHVILEVVDEGRPSLTRYRRIILDVR
ncbi:DUF1593 domain-containing protein [Luteitalea sp. TBR-22]|uniref:DUF1593 domain-containing protein n=1 Tax=Luteitalea sp. TBR-22 TaxID=2802971 RepID=UPI001EF42903|nr:nucleoside hydrolase-like domain-containing protein [Luteitalea sp. TBR-22]